MQIDLFGPKAPDGVLAKLTPAQRAAYTDARKAKAESKKADKAYADAEAALADAVAAQRDAEIADLTAHPQPTAVEAARAWIATQRQEQAPPITARAQAPESHDMPQWPPGGGSEEMTGNGTPA